MHDYFLRDPFKKQFSFDLYSIDYDLIVTAFIWKKKILF